MSKIDQNSSAIQKNKELDYENGHFSIIVRPKCINEFLF